MPYLHLPVGIKLVDPIDVIQKKILQAMRDKLNVAIAKAVPTITTAIQNRSRVFFETSPEALALINGPLDAHFGIPKGEAQFRVGEIIRTVINNIEVTFRRVSVRGGISLSGGLTVGAIIADYSDVLTNPEAIIVTDKGEDLRWLEWLLLQGDSVIISDHVIRLGNYSNPKFNSRSGKAIMVNQVGGLWRVPPKFSGTFNDNWFTRAILDAGDAWVNMIGDVMQKEIEAAF